MYVYYRRPYPSIPQRDSNLFKASVQNVVNKADCTNCWLYCYVDGHSRSYNNILENTMPITVMIGDEYLERSYSQKSYEIHYLDFEIGEADDIKNAFNLINDFCHVNNLITDCTLTKKQHDGLYITYFNSRESNPTSGFVHTRISFVISDNKRPFIGYKNNIDDKKGEKDDYYPLEHNQYQKNYLSYRSENH